MNNKGRNKKIAIVLSYLTMLVQFAVVFWITPYILKVLGKSEYGLYQLVASTASYLSLIGLGFSAAYIRFYSKYKSEDDEDGISVLNGMFMTIFVLMSICCMIVGSIVCINIETVLGNKLDVSQYREARQMFFVLMINMALTFPKSLFVCNTTAHERFVFQKSLILLLDIITPFLQIILLSLNGSALSIVFATFAVTLIDFITNLIFNCTFLKMHFIFGKFDAALFKELTVFTFFIFLNQILDLLSSTNIDNYLIGRLIGTDGVTTYSIGSKINQMFQHVGYPISSVFIPAVYRLVVNGNRSEISNLFVKVGKLQFTILYLIFSGFVIWGKQFVNVWVGEGYLDSYYIALVLMSSLIVALSQNIGIEIQRADNKHQVRSIVYLIIDIGNVLISIPLIRVFGPIGAAAGTAMTGFLGTILFMNWYYKKHIKIAIWEYWANLIKVIVSSIPCIVIIVVIRRHMLNSGIRQMIFQILLYIIMYAVMMYFFVLNKEEKKRIIRH